MKTASHQSEDTLLEFAYGELPPHEAKAVDAHVRGCPRCAEALSDIRMVRTTMDQFPMEEAPEAGLESLLAYAEQQATRNRATAPSPWWRRVAKAPLIAAVSSVAALAVVGLLAWEANTAYAPSPGAVALEAEAKRDAPSAPSPAAVAVAEREEKGAKVEGPVETERLEAPLAVAPGQPKMRKAKQSSSSSAKEPTGGFVATGSAGNEAESQAQGKELGAGGRALREDDHRALEGEGSLTRGSLARQERADKKDTNAAAPTSPAFDQPQVAESVAAPPPPAKSLGLSGFEARASKDEPRRLRALVEAARAAGLEGNLEAEVRLAVTAIASGVSGADSLDMLHRLCVGYERLGDPERGDPYCDRLLTEFPTSASAVEITSRRKGVQRVPIPASSAGPAEAVEPAKARPAERAK